MVELNLGTNQLTKIPDDVSSLASLEVDFTQKYDKYDKIFQAILNGKLNNQIDAFNFMQFFVFKSRLCHPFELLLQVLILSNNHLRKIPAGIGQLSR